MRLVLFFLLFVSFSFLSNGQVNRYSKPAESTFENTYVSPDYNLLFELGTIAKQRELKIKKTIQEFEELYKSYPKYPSIISNGWHDIIIISDDKTSITKAEGSVNFNNEIEMIKIDGELLKGYKEKIENGKFKFRSVTVYFFEDIWICNKY
ncbi:hypothetical protein [Parabacteroides sp.]